MSKKKESIKQSVLNAAIHFWHPIEGKIQFGIADIAKKRPALTWQQVRDALYQNARGMEMTTIQGQSWGIESILGKKGMYHWVKMNITNGPEPSSPPETRATQQVPKIKPPRTKKFLEVTQWWNKREDQQATLKHKAFPDHCPSFKVPSGSTSLRLRPDLIAAAEERAKKLWPGEHVSKTQLLNFLLWWFAEKVEG